MDKLNQMIRYTFVFLIFSIILNSCTDDTVPEFKDGIVLPKTSQRQGNPTVGYDYLVNGDYLSSGIPLETYKLVFQNDKDDLGRQGLNSGINYQFTALKNKNGVVVVTQNCLTCHATKVNDKVIVGLGNNLSNYTIDQSSAISGLENIINFQYGANSQESKAFKQFSKATTAIGSNVVTQVFGVNPADKVFAVLAGHRDPLTLVWSDNPSYSLPKEVVPTDVPPWWHMKKKNALYYNGLGQGDFARLNMASSLLTMVDTIEAQSIESKFADIVSFVNSIEAPAYPFAIDKAKAKKGETIFVKNCGQCHGSYGSKATYPNFLIPTNEVGTDRSLVDLYKTYPQYHEWYNKSWFSKGPYKAQLIPQDGYVAPPLDGIWATAPYLHNGSVPSLMALLDSGKRPKYWKRTSEFNDDFDEVQIGWKYLEEKSKTGNFTYDTSIKGYGNGGHFYGDKLDKKERENLLEYLKTL